MMIFLPDLEVYAFLVFIIDNVFATLLGAEILWMTKYQQSSTQESH